MDKVINHNMQLLDSIVSLIDSSRNRVASTINLELTLLYWNIRKQINDNILKNARADYGKQILPILSKELTERYGNGFSKRNLRNFIDLNTQYQDVLILHTLCAKLRWSHIRNLLPIEDENKPIGLILCSEKSYEQINYLMLENSEQIKVAEYLTKLHQKQLLIEKLNNVIILAKNRLEG